MHYKSTRNECFLIIMAFAINYDDYRFLNYINKSVFMIYASAP